MGKRYHNSPVIGDGGLMIDKGDNARFLRHALASYNLPTIDISDPDQVKERIGWYFQHCLESDMKPTVTGLCNSLGISRDTLNKWKNGETRALTHSDTIKKAYNILSELWEDYMLNGKINPVAGIFIGKNHFGYSDVQNVEITPKPLGEIQDQATIEAKYAELPDD